MSAKKAKTKNRINGEGSFYQDKSKGRWYGVVTVGYDADDKPIRKKVSDKSQSEALKKFDELKEQVRKGTYVDRNNSSKLEDIILLQIEKDKALNINKPSSYIRRLATLKAIQRYKIAKYPIQDIDDTVLLMFFNKITDYSQSYIRKIYGQINSAMKYAQSRDIIIKNPLDYIKQPKSKKATKKISALTVYEQQKFVDVLQNQEKDNYYKQIFELMLCTGMRCGEVLALKKSDINLDFKYIKVCRSITRDEQDNYIVGTDAKTESSIRNIKINNSCEKVINRILSQYTDNPLHLLFYNADTNKIYTTAQVNTQFKKIIDKYQIIKSHKEMTLLADKKRKSIAYKPYTYYKKVKNEYEILKETPPPDWNKNFHKYYYKKTVPEKPYNVHMLRHTFATRCIESGMPVKVLQKILGHSDIETTLNTYCDVFDDYENKATEQAEKYMQKLSLIS